MLSEHAVHECRYRHKITGLIIREDRSKYLYSENQRPGNLSGQRVDGDLRKRNIQFEDRYPVICVMHVDPVKQIQDPTMAGANIVPW